MPKGVVVDGERRDSPRERGEGAGPRAQSCHISSRFSALIGNRGGCANPGLPSPRKQKCEVISCSSENEGVMTGRGMTRGRAAPLYK